MAIISRIRKHSGLLIILIGVALAGFVLQDFFRKGGGGNKKQIFAKINGEKINKIDFDQRVDDQTKRYLQQSKKENLTSEENFQIMVSAWDQFEKDMIMQKEYEELGLAIDHESTTKPSISPEELYDLMLGKNLHPYIIQNFTDPNTGVVNKQAIQNYVNNFDQLTDEQKTEWRQFEQGIKDDRIKTKYNTLISQGYYIPKAFLQRMSDDATKNAKLLCVGVKYQAISDSAVKVSDEDFNKFYDEHKHEYEQENARDLDYVIFEAVPSQEDMRKITEKVNLIYTDFQKVESKDIENFVKANSDAPYDSSFFSKGKLPLKLDSVMFASQVGTIIPPYIEENSFKIARLVQIQNRPDSIKASQILIAYKDAPNPMQNITRTKDQAKKTADSILEIVKKDPKIFASMAAAKSDFSTAKKDGGDLKWIADGDANYKFFFDSCLISKVGDIKIIQSALGYHVLYITGKKDPVKKVKVAIVKHDIKPSSETYNKFQLMASEFSGANRTTEQFNKTVADKGLNKRSAQFVKEMDYTIPGLESARDIIRWAFDEKTEKGMVSEQVFDNSTGKFVVVLVVEKRVKGIAPLEQIKTYIEPLVKREKKADQLIEKVKTASNATKDIYQIAQKLNVAVDTVDQLTFSAYNFPKYGPEPELIGTIFTMKKNELSAPVKGKMAIYEVFLQDIAQPQTSANLDMIKMQTISYFKSRVENEVYKSIKDKTNIIDNRIFYY
jgi:peptidyl-prolyl cis-trans isomerase D